MKKHKKKEKDIMITMESFEKNVNLNTIKRENRIEYDPFLPDILMPELEDLVKKSPNKLIGCGG